MFSLMILPSKMPIRASSETFLCHWQLSNAGLKETSMVIDLYLKASYRTFSKILREELCVSILSKGIGDLTKWFPLTQKEM